MDIMTAIAATSKALDFAKLVNSIDREFSVSELKAKAADLLSSLADVKIALVEAKEELSSKDKEIERLRKDFNFREERTVVAGGDRYEKDSKGGPQGMPFCHRCEVTDGRLVRVSGTNSKDGYRAICPQCKADYGWLHGYTYEDRR